MLKLAFSSMDRSRSRSMQVLEAKQGSRKFMHCCILCHLKICNAMQLCCSLSFAAWVAIAWNNKRWPLSFGFRQSLSPLHSSKNSPSFCLFKHCIFWVFQFKLYRLHQYTSLHRCRLSLLLLSLKKNFLKITSLRTEIDCLPVRKSADWACALLLGQCMCICVLVWSMFGTLVSRLYLTLTETNTNFR